MTVRKSTASENEIISTTRCWVEQVIIGMNFCPFAKQVFLNERIHFQTENSKGIESCLQSLISECRRLDENENIETTLLVFSQTFQHFDDFLDLIEIANALLCDMGYEGVYQLAHFHPDYCFEGSDDSDPANYTNRSPWPTLHLIREASIEKVLKHFPEPEKIPERNVEYARELGINKFKALLNSCSKKN